MSMRVDYELEDGSAYLEPYYEYKVEVVGVRLDHAIDPGDEDVMVFTLRLRDEEPRKPMQREFLKPLRRDDG